MLQNFGTALSREQMKKVMGGLDGGGDGGGDDLGCGTGISCAGKKLGDSCGTNSCVCDTAAKSKDNTLYCQFEDI